jgi:hypothetical protein
MPGLRAGLVVVQALRSAQRASQEGHMASKRETKSSTKPVSRGVRTRAKKARKPASPKAKPAGSAGRSSKQAQIIALLRRPGGATITDLAVATGWQHHSIRGLISGALKKKLGLSVQSSKTEHGRCYRIADHG